MPQGHWNRVLPALMVGVLTLPAAHALAQPEAAPATPTASAPASLEITFKGAEDLELRGTLLIPVGAQGMRHPALVLLPGSGPTDRDGNQKPLLVTDLLKQIADRLAQEGIATLRFDKRATAGYRASWPKEPEALGEYFRFENFTGDASGAVAFLRARPEIDPGRVGMLGHSEGGLITLQVAHDLASGERPLRGIALLATAGRPLGPVVREQIAATLKLQGADEATTKAYMAATDRAIEMVTKEAKTPADTPAGLVALFNPTTAKLLQAYFTLDPAALAASFAGPALVVQGDKDVQVSIERDTPLLKAALENRATGVTEVFLVPGASHTLKPVTGPTDPGFTGPAAEGVLDRVAAWAKKSLSE